MVESVVRLLSRNGVTSIDETPQHPVAKSKSKKSKQHAPKRRRAQQSFDAATGDGNGDDDSERYDDDPTELFDAAQVQLMQEMATAGLEGSLPMSFGSSKRHQQQSIRSHTTKRQRPNSARVDDTEQTQLQQCAAAPHSVSLTALTTLEPRSTLAKVHVKYDSDGEVAERVVHKVADPLDVAAAKANATHVSGAAVAPAAVAVVTSKQQSLLEHEAAASTDNVTAPVDAAVLKFWKQRYHLFYRFDDGIQLDHESWYSVTPQAIAEHIASRLACDVVVDPFSGCGGNAIQLARVCRHVIAIEIDPAKVRMAQHNARLYGVHDRIEWVVGDAIALLPHVRADVVFLSPPWGGLAYSRERFALDDMRVSGVSGSALFALARRVSRNVAYYVPKTTATAELEALAPLERVDCERIFLNRQLKVVTAYYGDLAIASESCAQLLQQRETNSDRTAAAVTAATTDSTEQL